MLNTSMRNTFAFKDEGFFYHIIVTVHSCRDCACSCTILGVVIGIFVVIIVALVVYILWLHKKGKQYSKFSLYLLTVTVRKLVLLIRCQFSLNLPLQAAKVLDVNSM